jgi:hypothetical protein
MAADPTPPGFTNPPIPPTRADSTNFAARSDSFLSWLGLVLVGEMRAALAWMEAALDDVTTSSDAAEQAATTAADAATVTTADRDAVLAATPVVLSARDIVVAKEAAAASAAAAAAASETAAAASAEQAAISAANAGYADVKSPTPNSLEAGEKIFVVNAVRAYVVSMPVRVIWSSTVYAQGTVTAINGLAVTVQVTEVFGAAGTYGSPAAPWTFAVMEGINAPTKTGAGATGSWPIDIDGNAHSASKLTTERSIGGVAFDGSASIDLPGVNKPGNQPTTGNAATASKLATERSIGGVAFDGSASIDLPGVNEPGNQPTTGNAATASRLATERSIGGVAFDGSASIDLPGVNKPGNQPTTGNAATASKLAVPRKINGVPFDGTSDITTPPAQPDAIGGYALLFLLNVSPAFPQPGDVFTSNGVNMRYSSVSATYAFNGPYVPAAQKWMLCGYVMGGTSTQVQISLFRRVE